MAGDHVAGLADYVRARRPDLDLRVRLLAEIGAEDLAWADVYLGFRPPPVGGWGNVRWIHSIGAGVDGLLRNGPPPEQVLLTRSPEDFGPAIGEWCLARALAANQRLFDLEQAQAERRWGLRGTADPIMLRGQRLVVLGTGLVGRGVARAFRALGCRVDGLSRRGEPADPFQSVAPAGEFARVMAGADWLVLAAPLTAATRGFVDRRRLAHCGGAYLMNVGRGGVVDESALIPALDAGWIRGAALDVFAVEPLPVDSPLWAHPKVVIAPHNSGPSTVIATGDGFLECLSEVEGGRESRWRVAPDRGY